MNGSVVLSYAPRTAVLRRGFRLRLSLRLIPFGIVLTRLPGGPDLRSVGSGNIGATNVLRTGRKGLAAATLIGDMLKGTVAVLSPATGSAMTSRLSPRLVRLSAIYFRSGCAFAAARASRPILACFLALPGRRPRLLSGLAGDRGGHPLLVAGGADRQRRGTGFPVVARRGCRGESVLAVIALLWIMHRANIARLVGGTEGKIGARSSGAGAS